MLLLFFFFFFFSSRRRHTRCLSDWSSDVCSSDLRDGAPHINYERQHHHDGDDSENGFTQRLVAEKTCQGWAKLLLDQIFAASLHLIEQVTKPAASRETDADGPIDCRRKLLPARLAQVRKNDG